MSTSLEYNKDTYKHIMKATSLFGGVQVVNILLSIIRTKFVAVILGVNGVGIMGLFQNTLSLISSLSGLGITSSAIREVASANSTGDKDKIARVIFVFRRWVLTTGILGSLVALVISPFLSFISFGSRIYTWEFVALSVTVTITAVSSGQFTILRGLRRNYDMVKANILGSVFGLVITIPLYYFYALKGIVPSLIISSCFTLLVSTFFINRIHLNKVFVPLDLVIKEGSEMVKFGILMTLSGLITTASGYLLNIFISYRGGIQDVGLYQVGLSITTKYVGLVFTAMAMDYYPRLASIQNDNNQIKLTVNQQAEVSILILTPIVVLLIATMPAVISLLYSVEFLGVVELVQWLSIGIIIKATSWSIGFIVLAKGNSKLFFLTELIGNLFILFLNIFLYGYLGLRGLGISFIFGYLVYMLMILFVCSKFYNFSFNSSFLKVLIICLIISIAAFLSAIFLRFPITYFTGPTLLLVSVLYSIKILNKRMNFINLIKVKLKL